MQKWQSVPWQQHHQSKGWMNSHLQEWHQQCKARGNQFHPCPMQPTNYRARPMQTKYSLLLWFCFQSNHKKAKQEHTCQFHQAKQSSPIRCHVNPYYHVDILLWGWRTLHQQTWLTQSRPPYPETLHTASQGCKWGHKQCQIRHPAPLLKTICTIKTSRHIPGLPHISDEHGQNIRWWHSFGIDKGRHQRFQGRRHLNNMQRGTNPHRHPRKPRTITNNADATTRPLATMTPIHKGMESTMTGQPHLRSTIYQAFHQVDACRLWIPSHIDLAQSHQSKKLHRMANADRMQCPKVLSQNYQNRKRAPEPNKKECKVHQSQGHTAGNMQHHHHHGKKVCDVYTQTYMVHKTMFSD